VYKQELPITWIFYRHFERTLANEGHTYLSTSTKHLGQRSGYLYKINLQYRLLDITHSAFSAS
jgi:hypothetical protein